MRYKTFGCMNIAIIGTGKNCEALAKGLAAAGHEVFIGMKSISGNGQVSHKLLEAYENIYITTVHDAAVEADVILITTPATEVREVAYMLDDVRKKTIIDLSSFNFVRHNKHINTYNAIKAITGSQNIVKCYNVTGYEDLVNPEIHEDNTDMFIAGDSKKSKEMVKLLARDIGFVNCFDFGDYETVPMLDHMSECWNNRAVKQKVQASLAYKLVAR